MIIMIDKPINNEGEATFISRGQGSPQRGTALFLPIIVPMGCRMERSRCVWRANYCLAPYRDRSFYT
jgi:hypothetical protein